MFCEKAREAPAKNKKNKPGRLPGKATPPAGREVLPAPSARRRRLRALPLRQFRRPSPGRETPRRSPRLRQSPQPRRPDLSPLLLCPGSALRSLPPAKPPRAPAARTTARRSIVSSKSPLLPALAGTKQRSPARSGLATPAPHAAPPRRDAAPRPQATNASS